MSFSSDQDEQQRLTRIHARLANTPYACTSLIKLVGGTANFVYRGTLRASVGDPPATTVVVKLSTPFVAINKDFPLDITRCTYEETMLNALPSLDSNIVVSDGGVPVVVQAPRLYIFDDDVHLQVHQDCANTTDLTSLLQSDQLNAVLHGSAAEELGQALGIWLRSFHTWAEAPQQHKLVAEVGPNPGMRRLKRLITYDSFIEILERHPELLHGQKEKLEEVQAVMQAEFERPVSDVDEFRGLIHGDFWSGNVLIPNQPWNTAKRDGQFNNLFIIDWENAQYGHRAVDIGGMLADLYERYHFRSVTASLDVIRGFVKGYGPVPQELAFRVAIHAGVHTICWYYRRNRNSPLPFPLPKVLDALTMGRDLILHGWAQDIGWLREQNIVAPLFIDDNTA